jgi:hypothetical protein
MVLTHLGCDAASLAGSKNAGPLALIGASTLRPCDLIH